MSNFGRSCPVPAADGPVVTLAHGGGGRAMARLLAEHIGPALGEGALAHDAREGILGLAKRRNELLLLGKESTGHRPILDAYTPELVDELISVVTPITLITYILYTLDTETTERFHSDYLYTTSLFVVFGIFRYLYLVHRENLGGSPTDIVVKDGPMLGALIGWIATFTLFVYLG